MSRRFRPHVRGRIFVSARSRLTTNSFCGTVNHYLSGASVDQRRDDRKLLYGLGVSVVMKRKQISVVIPTLNEEGNIEPLIKRLVRMCEDQALTGELLFIDDRSTDGTRDEIARLSKQYRETLDITCRLKQGNRGKAQSLIEGFALAQYETIVMIDADLQYPPEAIASMVAKLDEGVDIVVADRKEHDTDFLRKLLSKTFHFVFSRFLHDLHCDSQSGLKVFRKKILNDVSLSAKAWAFDMEFLLQARNYGYVIDSVEIVFAERQAGESKLQPIQAILEIGWSALKLRWHGQTPLVISSTEKQGSMIGAGIAHNRQRFVTHTTLPHHISALHTFAPWQRNLIWGVLLLMAIGLLVSPLHTGIVVVAVLTAIYFIDAMFNLFLVMKSLKTPPELSNTKEELAALDDVTLPVYSVLCPLYKEAHMLPTFISAMQALDWPKEKLDVMLLLEENDPETIMAAQAMDLPGYVRIVVVPHSMPKTKPKACNYGLSFASGEYVVIYDAEDIPEPSQLKKAYLGFKNSDPSVRCLQAKLNYFNPHQNLLTRLFTAEYSLWFDVILPGLQSINTSIPLGGTSNHFRTVDLLELEGWDPFNVTEDCDLGARIFKRGFRTAIIDSVTLEEANSDVKNWIRQRSRWIKGYMQTYLVHMRHPVNFVRENGWHALIFQLVVGGKIGFMFINPFLWLATLTYFTLYAIVGPTLEALFPPLVFYFAAISLVFGNFLYLYYYMIGTAKREHFQVVKYVFLVPFYWFLVSWAAFIGLYELIVKPHYWQKTLHGLHVKKAAESKSTKKQAKFLSNTQSENRWHIAARLMHLEQMIVNHAPRFIPKSYLHFVFSNKGVLIGFMVLGNVFNFIFNAFLGRVLSFAELNLVVFMSTLWFITTIFVSGFGSTTNHRVSYLLANKGKGAMWAFFLKNIKDVSLVVIAVAIAWILAAPLLAHFFQVQDAFVIVLFTPAIIAGLFSYAFQGFLKGSLRFFWAAVVLLSEAASKLLYAIVLTYAGFPELAYLSIPLSLMTAALFGFLVIWNMRASVPQSEIRERLTEKEITQFPFKFFFSSMATSVSTIIFLSVDVLLVKHFFGPVEAGQYALLSLVGKMVFFLGSLPTVFMVTFVSRNDGLKKSSKGVLTAIFLAVLALTGLAFLVFGLFGFLTAPVLFGLKAVAIVQWLPLYTLSIALFTLGNVIVVYHLAKRHYAFSLAAFLLALSMVAGLWLDHDEFSDVVEVIFRTSFISATVFTVMHSLESALPFFGRGLRDLWGVFRNGLPQAAPRLITGKRILIFNWRDTTHTFAGGAEVYVHEIAKTWVKSGHHVTLFCGNDGKQSRYETIDGIDIVRRGGFYLVYIWAFLYYVLRFRNKYDIVVDCENGIPFFTPVYVKQPIYCLMHHVHQDVFFRSLPKPLAWLASALEKDLMPLVYRSVPFITVSESSREEMRELGIGQAGITIVHPGIDMDEFSTLKAKKTTHPTILYLGRLKAYKSVNVLIQAFRIVLSERPEARLIIAGDGEERESLKRLAKDLRLSSNQIHFLGSVSHGEKLRLLQSSWMLVNPSFMEGWGIVVIEANACGTPVIASNVPGLRDSVKNADTGYLVDYGDVKAFAETMLLVIRDTRLRETLANGGRAWAENFDWKLSGTQFLSVINGGESETK